VFYRFGVPRIFFAYFCSKGLSSGVRPDKKSSNSPIEMISCIPLNDKKEHARTMTCWCSPLVRWEDEESGEAIFNGPQVIHHAADCREARERQTGMSAGLGKTWGVFED
jgi:hypothetical protein